MISNFLWLHQHTAGRFSGACLLQFSAFSFKHRCICISFQNSLQFDESSSFLTLSGNKCELNQQKRLHAWMHRQMFLLHRCFSPGFQALCPVTAAKIKVLMSRWIRHLLNITHIFCCKLCHHSLSQCVFIAHLKQRMLTKVLHNEDQHRET